MIMEDLDIMDEWGLASHPKRELRLSRQCELAVRFTDLSTSIEDIIKILDREDMQYDSCLEKFVGAFDDSEPEGKVLFGVNVRLNSRSTGVFPFIHTNIRGFDQQTVAQRIHEDYNIFSLNSKYCLKEALVKFVVDDDGKITSYDHIESISTAKSLQDRNAIRALMRVLEYTDDSFYKTGNVESDSVFGNEFLDDFVNVTPSCNGKDYMSVITSNLKEFDLKGGSFYMWIVSEDFDLEKMKGVDPHGEQSGACFLSNIFAFTTTRYDMEMIRRQRSEIIRFMSLLKTRYILDMELQREKAAINSAKAAIMSRNMSHNLGSHVMYYIKQKLHDVQKIIDGGVLKNLKVDGVTDINSIKQLILENGKDLEMPFLVGLGRFINYLQERQDYIATVATDYIPSNSTISFKDFVYDELKPDLRYERHIKAGTSSSETSRQQPKNLLMDYIAFSEGYDTSDRIRIRFGAFDGKNPPLIQKGGVAMAVYDETTEQYKSLRRLRDFNVALPGGVIGRQALFSIMENIIRNAAKHGERRSDGLLAIDLDVLDPKDTSIYEGLRHKAVNASAEVSKEELIGRYQAYKGKYTILSITCNMPNDKASVDKLVNGLAIPYIKPDATMEESGKGLKEIRISASWLRRYQHDMDIPADEPPAVSIRAIPYVDEKTGQVVADKVQIQYLICISKSKSVAFVVPEEQSKPADNKELAKIGCALVSESEAMAGHLYDYDLVVFCVKDNENTGELLSTLSSRYIAYDEKNVAQLSQMLDELAGGPQALRKHVGSFYSLWKDSISCDEDVKLLILDDRTRNARQDDDFVSEAKGGLLLETTSAGGGSYGGNVVYSTHHVSMCGVPEENLCGQETSAFIEGVTGNNSTDRLIRQTKWDQEWMSKHIVAGISKVAIFDERIFSKINPCLVNVDPKFVKGYLDRLFGNSETAKLRFSDLQKECKKQSQSCNLELFRKEFFANTDDKQSTSKFKTSIEITRADIERILEWFRLNERDTTASRRYHETNIWAFDIRRAENAGEVEVLGYNVQVGEAIGKYDRSKVVEAVMTIRECEKDGDRDFEMIFTNLTMKNRFNLMTVHQGILDKIYDAFGVKDQPKYKEKVTKCLYENLIQGPTVVELDKMKHNNVEYTPYFLPRMVIHSGRSKPGYNDMPQKLPFVQFAAIDHAVSDCKYTLSELLYSAHYENNYTN